MDEKIDWKQELLESQNFNKFQRNLLENGARNFMQGVYLGYLYARYKKLKGLNLLKTPIMIKNPKGNVHVNWAPRPLENIFRVVSKLRLIKSISRLFPKNLTKVSIIRNSKAIPRETTIDGIIKLVIVI